MRNPKRLLLLLLIGFLSPAFFASAQEGKEIPRVLLALYSSKDTPSPRFSDAHQLLEMPTNHLGFDLHHVDVEKPYPELGDEVQGIVVWLDSGRFVKNPDTYLSWLEKAVSEGKKLLIFNNLGVDDAYRKQEGAMDRINTLLAHIGLRDLNSYNSITYDGHILYQDDELLGFERKLPEALPPYQETVAIPGIGVSHLKVLASKQPETIHDLIVTGPGGGYVADGYTHFEGYPLLPIQDLETQKEVPEAERELPDPVRQWYLNPFLFLRMVLHDEEEPKPDVTTLNGLRIFYSHIDGDGWNTLTQIRRYAEKRMISAEVIEREVLAAHPDIPVNVSVITGDMDKKCYGLHGSIKVAKRIFRLPNVEPSSHTHTHPLFWNYFADYHPENELSVLDKYPPRSRGKTLYSVLFGDSGKTGWESYFKEHPEAVSSSRFEKFLSRETRGDLFRNHYYETPRSYACGPFDLRGEIKSSVESVRELAPKEKRDRIRLIQWSGDTSPFEAALKMTREAGLLNINGGDSRYDSEYPSYASVSPVGLQMGKERQIYSSNSNENTYTNLWTERFYGFKFLQNTVRNTESPTRVQPFNIYYHMYSGEKQASLAALLSNIEFAEKQNLSRIFASDFAEIAGGFYTTRIISEGEGAWRIENRGKLNTLRFDDATLKTVDFDRSQGVLGQKHFQGSLYVSLDPLAAAPRVVIRKKDITERYALARQPYLIHSSWLIKDLLYIKKSLRFTAQGYGEGEIALKFPQAGAYDVVVKRDNDTVERRTVASDDEGVVNFTLAKSAAMPLNVAISAASLRQ